MKKTKYYFGDRLVRTSERTYTHAVLRGDQVVACCGRLDLAEKEATRRKNLVQSNIDFAQKCLDAIRSGAKSFRHTERCGNRSFSEIIRVEEPAEYYESRINQLRYQLTLYRVEPLEAR